MSAPNDLILFHYPYSPFARRITWYLSLRQIPYAQCLQPPTLPRPDLERLGVSYRRIPILSHGRSVYCDTRLILQKLEDRFPNSALAATTPEEEAVRKLLENWTIDGGVFVRAGQTLPTELPIMQDPKFTNDREAFSGRSWSEDAVKTLRPEALVHIREAFDFLEDGLLADGREWILKTAGPSLADIEAVWPFHWLIDLKVVLPKELVSEKTHPRVFRWVSRFNEAVKAAKKTMPKPVTLSGDEAAKVIIGTESEKGDGGEDRVDEGDPIGLRQGMLVESWPTDSGFKNRDRGKLVRLSKQECVLVNEKGVRVHHPRWNFRIKEIKEGQESKL